tara:strand:+ start:160 stop:843 length:684 start_codon:yes stop_codon:yes gene_type:complete
VSFDKNFTVIIPLRDGSKELPNKNIQELNGKSLYLHAIDLALEANSARIIVTTNIDKVLKSEFDDKIQLLSRPEELCNDSTEMSPVLLHAIEKLEVQGIVVLLQATSPLRSLEDLKTSLTLFESSGSDIVLTVTPADHSVLKWGELSMDGSFKPLSDMKYVFSNRQSLPSICKPNGAIYVFKAEWLLKNKELKNAKTVSAVEMPVTRSHDIDTMEDLILCEKILKNS